MRVQGMGGGEQKAAGGGRRMVGGVTHSMNEIKALETRLHRAERQVLLLLLLLLLAIAHMTIPRVRAAKRVVCSSCCLRPKTNAGLE
jgi:hypothetical protein